VTAHAAWVHLAISGAVVAVSGWLLRWGMRRWTS